MAGVEAFEGVEAAARQFGLDIRKSLTEDYVFVCHRSILDTPAMQHILDVRRSPEIREAVSVLPGYQVREPCAIKTIREVFARSE